MLKIFPLQKAGVHALVLDGREAILKQYALLEALAQRCGQSEIICWLGHFLAMHSSPGKVPQIFLLLYPGFSPHELRSEDIQGAVLLFQHRVLGFATGVYAADSAYGCQTVIAAKSERYAVAIRVAKLLLAHNAQIVKISGEGDTEAQPVITGPMEGMDIFWLQQRGEFRYLLPLADTFESTLAALGKSTRFNLRYYRRRLLRRMQCEVVPDALDRLSWHELKRLNANSRHPKPVTEFKQQYENLFRLPGGFLFGVRELNGEWLGLIGGWRVGTTSAFYWQLNMSGYTKDSLVNVVRSYFLEHEVQLGARNLFVYTGTSHSMRHSFQVSPTFDLVVRRRSLHSALIRFFTKIYLAVHMDPPAKGLMELIAADHSLWSHLPAEPPRMVPLQAPPHTLKLK